MSDPNPDGDARLYVTHDAAAHWHRLALTGVTALTVAHGWVYAISRGGVYSAPTRSGRLTRVAAAIGDTLVPGRDAVYDYGSLDKARRMRVDRVQRLSGRVSTIERSPCGSFPSQAVAQDSSGQLIAVCGGEPATGQQLKRAYSQTRFGASWHRLANPGPIGYVGFALASSRVIVSGGRCPLYLSSHAGTSWRTARNPERSGDGFISGGFGDALNGWVIAEDLRQKLYLTENGGQTWHQVLR
jgi:hypothetical protein